VNLLRSVSASAPKIAITINIRSEANDIATFYSLRSLAIVLVLRARCSGHIHKPTTITNNDSSNVINIGSPYQTNLAEAGEVKRMLLLDASSWEAIRSIPLDDVVGGEGGSMRVFLWRAALAIRETNN